MTVFRLAALVGIAIIAPGAAFAVDIPHQKSGLWQSSMMMGGTAVSSQSCIDAATEAKMSAFSAQMRQKNCKSSEITHNADGSWASVSTCDIGGKTRTTRSKVTGDFNSKFTMVLISDGSTKPELTMTMTWMGPCKPGMRGGDVIMSNGMKMNVIDNTATTPGSTSH